VCREVVERSPSTQSYLLLGDAYMAITEPERALEVYEQVKFKIKSIFIFPEGFDHELINYIDTIAKCLNRKILTCKSTLRQVFIRVYRLEIQLVRLVFLTQLCELLPL
jgi:hypothetical protein